MIYSGSAYWFFFSALTNCFTFAASKLKQIIIFWKITVGAYFFQLLLPALLLFKMNITPSQVSELIRKRRSVFPKTYNGKPISREVVGEILENANWAPNHKKTEPWRFKVITGQGLVRLGGFLSSHYKKTMPPEKFSEVKFNKLKNNPPKAACIIAICMKRDPEERLPEWEEMAAVACAVQNMYLTCTAHGIGCFWSTPRPALEAGEFLGLKEGERCLGLFYMGHHDLPDLPRERKPVSEKTAWITE